MNTNQYLRDFFGVVDRMDAAGFAQLFDGEGSFKFANQEPAQGRSAVQALAQGVFDFLQGIGHQVTNTGTNTDGNLFVEGIVTYTRKDSKRIELPFACVFEFSQKKNETGYPLVARYRSYIDAAPLFQ